MVTWIRVTNPHNGCDIHKIIPDDMLDRAQIAAERKGLMLEITRRGEL